MSKSKQSGIERRKATRRPVVETFSVFLTVPAKGGNRLRVHDMSELGLGFDLDVEGEPAELFPTKVGQKLSIQFYFNPLLSVPMDVKIVRIIETALVRRVGVEIEKKSKGYEAFESFLAFVDTVDR